VCRVPFAHRPGVWPVPRCVCACACVSCAGRGVCGRCGANAAGSCSPNPVNSSRAGRHAPALMPRRVAQSQCSVVSSLRRHHRDRHRRRGCRYHKFFNINESREANVANIDFSRPHVILEKLDGSMVCTWTLAHLPTRTRGAQPTYVCRVSCRACRVCRVSCRVVSCRWSCRVVCRVSCVVCRVVSCRVVSCRVQRRTWWRVGCCSPRRRVPRLWAMTSRSSWSGSRRHRTTRPSATPGYSAATPRTHAPHAPRARHDTRARVLTCACAWQAV
jgi:hypothetical protein